MKRLLKRLFLLMIIVAMMISVNACDSSSSGGGGSMEAAYTQDMLTGTWKAKSEMWLPAAPWRGIGIDFDEFIFDANGAMVSNQVKSTGSLKVYPDGRVEGRIQQVVPLGATTGFITYYFYLKFKADGSLSGKQHIRITMKTGGVIGTDYWFFAKAWLTKQ